MELKNKGKWIKNYGGLYLITKSGKIYSIHKGEWLKPWIAEYIFIVLNKEGKSKTFRVHRLVAEIYIPNPLNYKYVNHKNGNKHDNHVSNLEWCSSSANQKHAYKTGLKSNAGENNSRAKLTKDKVITIKLLKRHVPAKILAKRFKINEQTIRDIWSGKRWKDVK